MSYYWFNKTEICKKQKKDILKKKLLSIIRKQRRNKRKVKKSIQKLAKRTKRQD